jgi:hypothetical protein
MNTARHDVFDTPSREELAALARTLVTLVCRIGEDLVDATDRCERCNGTAGVRRVLRRAAGDAPLPSPRA